MSKEEKILDDFCIKYKDIIPHANPFDLMVLHLYEQVSTLNK